MKRNPQFVLRELDDEAILVPISGELNFNGVIGLNGVARTIYESLDQAKDFDHLVEILCARYDAPRQQIAEDTAEFLRQLRQQRILLDEP